MPAVNSTPRTIPHAPDSARATVRPYSLWSLGFWKAYVVLMRPYLLFVSGVTGVAGLALVPEGPGLRLAILVPVFFGTYGFGQALTDCFQMDTDALSSPYRPLVRGTVRRSDVLGVSLAGLVASGIVLGLYDLMTLPLAALCIAGLATYTPFKRRWWAGPFYNAWIVAGLFAIAYLAGGGALTGLVRPAVAWTAGAVFFGYANFVLVGYYKDVTADRATGYETLPVRYGLRRAAFASDGFALATVACAAPALLAAPLPAGLAATGALALAGGGVGAVLLAQYRLHRVTDERDAHRAIAPVVHAYLLLLAALAAAHQPTWTIPLALGYGAFVLVLHRRPMQTQI